MNINSFGISPPYFTFENIDLLFDFIFFGVRQENTPSSISRLPLRSLTFAGASSRGLKCGSFLFPDLRDRRSPMSLLWAGRSGNLLPEGVWVL